jgi:DNA-binding beta-propeller fold protein YncE
MSSTAGQSAGYGWRALSVAILAVVLAGAGLAYAQRGPSGRLVQPSGKAGCIGRAGAACERARAIGQPGEVGISPDGRHAYVAAYGNNAVSVFARNRRTGNLRQLRGRRGCISERGVGGCAFGRGLDGALTVAVSSDGRNVYVAGSGSDAIAVFARNARTGALRQLRGPTGCASQRPTGGCAGARALDNPITVAVSRDGQRVYVASRRSAGIAVFLRGRGGQLTQPRGQDGCIAQGGREGCARGRGLRSAWDVAVSPDGRSVYATGLASNSLAVFQRTPTGVTQPAGEAGCLAQTTREGCAARRALRRPNGVAVSPDGKNVYVVAADTDAVAILRRDVATGTLAQPAGKGACVGQAGSAGCAVGEAIRAPEDVAVSPDGRNVYVVSATIHSLASFSRSPTTGGLRQLPGKWGCFIRGGVVGCQEGRGLTHAVDVSIAPDGRHVYTAAEERRFGALGIFRRLTH